jgi:hypothetical protein
MVTSIKGSISSVMFIEVSELNSQFIYGMVESPYLSHWWSRRRMIKGAIERVDTENLLVYTHSGIYKVDALPESISLNAEQFLMVKQGISPSCFIEVNTK